MEQDHAKPNARTAQRRKVLKTGKALLPGGFSVMDCVIRDVSDSGARLEVGDPLSLPDRFRLVCIQDNTMREVLVMWRREGRAGVAFEGPERRAPLRKW
jgi:hypothetical protein